MTMRLTTAFVLFISVVIAPPATAQHPAPSPVTENRLAITNVTVIDVARGEAEPGRTVVVAGSRLTAVGAADDVKVPADAAVDGTLGATDSIGTVEEGKLADLVLLDANPLEDISNTQRISAVVLDGDRNRVESAVLVGRHPATQDMTWIAEHHPERLGAFAHSFLAAQVPPDSAERDVLAMHREINEAMFRGDPEPLARAALDNLAVVPPGGYPETREQVIRGAQYFRTDSVAYSEREVRVRENTAVVTAKLMVYGELQGVDPATGQHRTRELTGEPLRQLSVFVREQGRWRLLAQSSTPIRGWAAPRRTIDQAQPGAAPAQVQDGWRTAAPADVGMDPVRLEELTRSLRSGEHGNVHAVLIEKDGRLVYEEYFTGKDEAWGADLGTVTFGRSSLHDLRSVTKSVVSTLVGIAIGRGEIPSVDTPIHELLPEYAHLLTGEKRRIQLRHVLTMSAGLDWDEWSIPYTNPTNDEIRLTRSTDPVEFVLGRERVSEPGTEFTYSGGLTQLLAAILERATDREIEAYAREVLFEPLGIYDAVWRGDLNGMPNVASGLRLRARDLAKLGSVFLHGGRRNGAQIVPEQWVDESTVHTWTVAYPGGSAPEFLADLGYGYQWWIGSYRTTAGVLRVPMMWGNGEQRVMVVPDLGIALTVFAGEYGEVTRMPDRLLVDYIIDAIIP